MKLLVDANLSPTVAEALRQAGHDATHVVEHGLMTASDERIAMFAVDQGQVIVSADSDFASMLALSRGVAPSLVLFRSADHAGVHLYSQRGVAGWCGTCRRTWRHSRANSGSPLEAVRSR